ncbi:phosphotransferase [Thiomicrospira sp. ALE5]|uniref:phosphotransferase n=1 Tax=Thiomicrospira sp. ALE5 TaxID=748650 RepID=UPI0008F0A2DD|nr:phosphotransferase [Thiomicrospira sp. ALE5]SFR49100.1 Phosphotransferase enzyme family protein [Thiomicrospira sp. ALE5]
MNLSILLQKIRHLNFSLKIKFSTLLTPVKRLNYLNKALEKYQFLSPEKFIKVVNALDGNLLINNFQHHSFLGFSSGRDKLGVKRLVKVNGKLYVEKIYLTNSESLGRSKCFHLNFSNRINSLKVQNLYRVYSGDFLTALYFKYISNCMELSNFDILKKYNGFLVDIPLSSNILENNRRLNKGVDNIRKFLKNEELLNFNKYYSYMIKNTPVVVCHGDFNKKNIIGDFVIDFDDFGYSYIHSDISYYLSVEISKGRLGLKDVSTLIHELEIADDHVVTLQIFIFLAYRYNRSVKAFLLKEYYNEYSHRWFL